MVENPTLRAYKRYAVVAMKNWGRMKVPSRFLRHFARRLPKQAAVLDYGCGIGTDMAWLQSQGFQVEGIDGVRAFINEARRRCPDAQLTCASFEDFSVPSGKYDGIWCNASFIHLSPAELKQHLKKLRLGLRPGGILGLTLAWGRSKKITRNDWIPGRYLACYTSEEILPYFRDWGIRQMKTVSNDGREGRWIQLLAVVE